MEEDGGGGWGGADADADRKRLAEKGQEGCPEQRMEGGGEGAHEGWGDAHVPPSSGPPTLSSAAITQQKKKKEAKIKENPPKARTDPTFGRFREDHKIHVGRKSN